MDYALIRRLLAEKLRDRGTYTLAFFVGTLINAYGHLLVPWFRTDSNPFTRLVDEFQHRPGLTTLSIIIAYVFPLCVGTYSVVTNRYRNRRIESIADFPEKKPDPVFRVSQTGEIIEAGAETRLLFDRYGVAHARDMLGESVWHHVLRSGGSAEGLSVRFEPENAVYLVRCRPTNGARINIYMTRLLASENTSMEDISMTG